VIIAICPYCLARSEATYWPRYCGGEVILKKMPVPKGACRYVNGRKTRIEFNGYAWMAQPIHEMTRMVEIEREHPGS